MTTQPQLGSGRSTDEGIERMECRPLISVVVVAYNAARFLPTCLTALRRQTYTNREVILVDTTPHDETTAAVAAQYPEVRLVTPAQNLGYAGGNNLGFSHARGVYIAILNPDTEPAPEWLATMVAALMDTPAAGLATSKIVYFYQRDTINACGNEVHYTGLATCRSLGKHTSAENTQRPVPAVSGAAFLIEAALFATLGGFDERFFMYLEDTDLSWRARLHGRECLLVPTSLVAHHYRTTVTPAKMFYLERNRGLLLLQNLRGATLFLISPALALTEVVTWGFALLRGGAYLRAKLQSYGWLLRHARLIGASRRRTQRMRRVTDAEVLASFGHQIHAEQVSSPLIAVPLRLVIEPWFRYWQRLTIALLAR